MKRCILLAAPAILLLLSCTEPGNDDDDDSVGDDDTVSLEVAGTITNDEQVETPAEIGMALVWSTEAWQGLDGSKTFAEETTASPPFPADFVLSFDAPPGAALMTLEEMYLEPGADPDARLAQGYLVVYADGNGNGMLDMLTEQDMELVDIVLGAFPGALYVLDSDAPLDLAEFMTSDGWGLELQPGLNLIQYGTDGHSLILDRLPDGTAVSLPLVDDSFLSYWLCPDGNHNIASSHQEECDGDTPSPDCPDLEALPVDAEVECENNGLDLTVTIREKDVVYACESFTSITHFTWSLDKGEEPPPGWPC